MAEEQQFTLTTLIVSLTLFSLTLAPAESSNSQTMNYIESSCNGTLYPNLCIRCLARYFSDPTNINGPQHLAQVALKVSLSRAIHTRGYLLKVSKELLKSSIIQHNNKRMEYLTVQDCVSQINDSVDQLSQAIKELRRINKFNTIIINDKVLWHISNVETWVSTALTDASSCVQSFPAGHRRMSKRVASIKVKAMNVAQVTSNALALFQRYASSYRQKAAAEADKNH